MLFNRVIYVSWNYLYAQMYFNLKISETILWMEQLKQRRIVISTGFKYIFKKK